jgi:hypothetical protein
MAQVPSPPVAQQAHPGSPWKTLAPTEPPPGYFAAATLHFFSKRDQVPPTCPTLSRLSRARPRRHALAALLVSRRAQPRTPSARPSSLLLESLPSPLPAAAELAAPPCSPSSPTSLPRAVLVRRRQEPPRAPPIPELDAAPRRLSSRASTASLPPPSRCPASARAAVAVLLPRPPRPRARPFSPSSTPLVPLSAPRTRLSPGRLRSSLSRAHRPCAALLCATWHRSPLHLAPPGVTAPKAAVPVLCFHARPRPGRIPALACTGPASSLPMRLPCNQLAGAPVSPRTTPLAREWVLLNRPAWPVLLRIRVV